LETELEYCRICGTTLSFPSATWYRCIENQTTGSRAWFACASCRILYKYM
jgi:hypothetical protein